MLGIKTRHAPIGGDIADKIRDAVARVAAGQLNERVTLQKRYVADNGILNLFLLQGDTKLLENLVAVELNRRFRGTPEEPSLYYYNKGVEVDFCVPSARLAIQVSYSLADADTRDRGVNGLLRFLDAYPDYQGLIITRDTEELIAVGGTTIKATPVWQWLLGAE